MAWPRSANPEDLRSLSPANQGCVNELEQLFASVLLTRVLLIIDPTTDWPLLEATLRRLWLTAWSENRLSVAHCTRLRVVRLKRSRPSELRAIARLANA